MKGKTLWVEERDREGREGDMSFGPHIQVLSHLLGGVTPQSGPFVPPYNTASVAAAAGVLGQIEGVDPATVRLALAKFQPANETWPGFLFRSREADEFAFFVSEVAVASARAMVFDVESGVSVRELGALWVRGMGRDASLWGASFHTIPESALHRGVVYSADYYALTETPPHSLPEPMRTFFKEDQLGVMRLHQILGAPNHALKLTDQTYYALRSGGLECIGLVVQETGDGLLKVKDIGPQAVHEIEVRLGEFSERVQYPLRLGMSREDLHGWVASSEVLERVYKRLYGVLDGDVRALGLDRHFLRGVRREGVNVVGRLLMMSEEEILRIRGVGRSAVTALKKLLPSLSREAGTELHLAMTDRELRYWPILRALPDQEYRGGRLELG